MRTTRSTRTWTTAGVLLGALAALAGCGGGASGSGSPAISFIGPTPPSVFMFPGFVADELGFFEEEGIDFEYETIGEDVALTTPLEQGQVDISGPGATAVFQAVAAGQEFEIVYDYITVNAKAFAVAADSDATSVADLEGGTIGVADSETASLVPVALEAAGLDASDVESVMVGTSTATVVNALTAGTIDAFVGSVVDFAGLKASGFQYRDITPEELASFPAGSFAVKADFAQDHRDQLEGFMRAWAKGQHAGLTDPALTEAIMREVAPEEWEDEDGGKASLDVALDLHRQGPEAYGAVDADLWRNAMEEAVVAGDIDEPFDVGGLLNDEHGAAANDFDRAEVEKVGADWLAANA